MSYSMVLRRPYALSALGAGQAYISAAAQLPSCDLNTGNAATDAAYKQCCEHVKGSTGAKKGMVDVTAQIKACSTKALDVAKATSCDIAADKVHTGISYIDDAFRNCCEGAWKGSGNVAERTKKLAVCTANAAASAALAGTLASAATTVCVAAGAATAGITTVLAATGICAIVGSTVGVFIYNRISGYSTQSLILGGAAAAVCGVLSGGALALVCGVAIAELVEWISGVVGPVLEHIFDPDAAERRARAERLAAQAARDATRDSLYKAQEEIVKEWTATVNRLWDLYEKAFTTVATRASAKSVLGITNTYDSIAEALLAASRRFPTQAEAMVYRGYDAAQKRVIDGSGQGIPYTRISDAVMREHANSKTYWANCEAYGRLINGSYGPPSAICPPFPDQDFLDEDFDASNKAGGGVQGGRSKAYYEQQSVKYMLIVKDFFTMLPMAETIVASNITTYAAVKQAQDLLTAAQQQTTRHGFAVKASKAAAKAQAAAAMAAKGNAAQGKTAILQAKQNYNIAVASYVLLLDTYGPRTTSGQAQGAALMCVKDADCKMAADAVARAKASSELAVANAAHASNMRTLTGAAVVAAAAGGAYLLLRGRS